MLADAQRPEVARQPNPNTAATMRANVLRNDAGAQLALVPGHFLPRFVSVASDGRALVWIRHYATLRGNPPAPAALYIVDLRTGEVSRRFEAIPEFKRIVSVDDRLERLVAIVEHQRILTVATFDIASGRVREIHVHERLHWPGDSLQVRDSMGQWTTVEYGSDPASRTLQLAIFDRHSGARRPALALRDVAGASGEICWSVASHAPVMAASYPGGSIEVADYTTGQRREFRPHRRVGSEDRVRVLLSRDGRFLASIARSELAMTDLSTGASRAHPVPVASQPRRIKVGEWVAQLDVLPDIAFVGDALIFSRDGEAETVDKPSASTIAPRKPVKVNRKQPIRKQLEAAGLEKHAARLEALHSPAALMLTKPLRGPMPLGSSRIGGWPDLSPDSDWPLWNGRPMAFIAQVSLDEAHRAVPGLRLPRSGLLSFFIACSDEVWTPEPGDLPYYGTETSGAPGDLSRVKILHLADCTSVQGTRWTDAPAPPSLEPRKVTFKESRFDWPEEYSPAIAALSLDIDEAQAYAEFSSAARGPEPEEELDQLLGYRFDGSERPEVQIDPAHAADLVPLLDLSSESVPFRLEAGPTRVYVERARLERGDFSKAYLYYDFYEG
jgi:hypothetical protein